MDIDCERNNEFGLYSLDDSQIEQIHNLIFEEEDISEFKTVLGKLDWKEMHQFLNSCFFIYEAINIKSDYCDAIKYVLCFIAIESIMGNQNYVPFNNWLISKNIKKVDERKKIIDNVDINFEGKIKKLYEIYRKEYGVTEQIRKFFRGYISKENLVKILNSITKINYITNYSKRNEEIYSVENDRIKLTIMDKNFNILKTIEDKEEINQKIDKKIYLLYDTFRNQIVHEGARGNFLDEINIKGCCAENALTIVLDEKYCINIKKELEIKEFSRIVLDGIKKYYIKIQEE